MGSGFAFAAGFYFFLMALGLAALAAVLLVRFLAGNQAVGKVFGTAVLLLAIWLWSR